MLKVHVILGKDVGKLDGVGWLYIVIIHRWIGVVCSVGLVLIDWIVSRKTGSITSEGWQPKALLVFRCLEFSCAERLESYKAFMSLVEFGSSLGIWVLLIEGFRVKKPKGDFFMWSLP